MSLTRNDASIRGDLWSDCAQGIDMCAEIYTVIALNRNHGMLCNEECDDALGLRWRWWFTGTGRWVGFFGWYCRVGRDNGIGRYCRSGGDFARDDSVCGDWRGGGDGGGRRAGGC
jgi:hypothetical protein